MARTVVCAICCERFGDDVPGHTLFDTVNELDGNLLHHVENADGVRFLNEPCRVRHRYRVCGTAPIYEHGRKIAMLDRRRHSTSRKRLPRELAAREST